MSVFVCLCVSVCECVCVSVYICVFLCAHNFVSLIVFCSEVLGIF